MVFIIYEDDETFWGAFNSGVGTYFVSISNETINVKTGYASTRMTIVGGTNNDLGLQHTFSPVRDFTGEDVVYLYVYGVNSGLTIRVEYNMNVWFDKYIYEIVDSWSGWQLLEIPRASFTAVNAPNWATIETVAFMYRNVNQTLTSYLDHWIHTDSGYTPPTRIGMASYPSRLGHFKLGHSRLGVYR